jgi:mono/diheme cytochrome c family protein
MLVAAVAVGATVYWTSYPSTPAELYQKRCSSCHQLQDLSGYAQEELAPLVSFMRTHNGANRVISEREALIIIQFLEQTWPLHSVQTAK